MRRIIFLFTLCLTFTLVACGRGRQTTDENEVYSNSLVDSIANGGAAGIGGSQQADQAVRTLTILATYCDYGGRPQMSTPTQMLRIAEREMQRDWRNRDEAFHVESEMIRWSDFQAMEVRNQRLAVQLMAGDAPDIILVNGQNIRAMAEQGFLVNFYDLIDQDQYLSRDDFFTQALSAFEVSGGLYALPVSFGFEYVGINAHLPQHIIDVFTQKSFITVDEMMDIYLALRAASEYDFGHLVLGISAEWGSNRLYESFIGLQAALATESNVLFETFVGRYIDFDTRMSDLTNPSFASSLSTMREIFGRDIANPTGYTGASTYVMNWRNTAIVDDRLMSAWANEYVFGIKNSALSPVYAFITPITPQFVHYIPLVDNEGRLLISPNPINEGGSWSTVATKICITVTADIDLAWEFVQYMLEAYAINSLDSLATPILREHFHEQTRLSIYRALGQTPRPSFVGRGDPDQHALIRDYTIQRIADYNEMPMALISTMIPHVLYEENLDLFLRGIISTEDFIQRLHNSVALWLIE